MRAAIHIRKFSWLLTLGAAVAWVGPIAAQASKYPGVYRLVGYAEPGTHEAGKVPPALSYMQLTIREDGSVTMRTAPGSEDQDGEFVANPADGSAIITDGPDAFRCRFSHDTLVTRIPGGGPIFYWQRTKEKRRCIRCSAAKPYLGTYRLVAQAQPGTHIAGAVAPDLAGTLLTIREDGSVTMRTPGVADQEADLSVAEDASAVIVMRAAGIIQLRGRFNRDTLVTREPLTGAVFYWKRARQ